MTRGTRLGLLALACVIGAIMVFDVRARLRAVDTPVADQRQSSTHQGPAVPEVQRGLDKTPLVYPAQFIDQLVQRSRDAFVLARDEGASEPVPGVIVGPREVLVASPRTGTTWALATADGRTLRATRRASDPVRGISLLELAEPSTVVVSFGPPALTSGSPVVAVRPTPAALVTQLIPAPGTEASLTVRLAGSAMAPGTAVIDLDGRLVAFLGAGVEGGAPLLANELDTDILPVLRRGEVPAIAWLGADLQAIDERLAAIVGEGLAVVTWVDPGSPAGSAGLQASDAIVAAKAGNLKIPTLAALQTTLEPDLPLTLEVRRRARTRTVSLVVGRRTYPRGVLGTTGVAVHGGAPTLRVAPASPLARAGLRTGDVVEAVNGRVVSAEDLERILRRGGAVLLTVRRDGERRFVVPPVQKQGAGQGT